MKNKKNVVLYETMFFPVWLLMFMPRAWLVILPLLFILDSAAMIGLLWHFEKKDAADRGAKAPELTEEKRGEMLAVWKKCIVPAWIISFISWLLSAGMLMMTAYIPGILSGEESWWSRNIAAPVSENPLSNFFSIIVTLCCAAFAAYITYSLNRRISFRKLDLCDEGLERFARWFSALTAPYVLLLPSVMFWS